MHCDEYRSAMGKVSASPELKARLVAAMERGEAAPRAKARRFPVRIGLTAAAAAAVLALAAPAFLGGMIGSGGAQLSAADAASTALSQAAAAAAPEEENGTAGGTYDAAPEAAAAPQDRMAKNGAQPVASAEEAALGNPTLDLTAEQLPASLPLLRADVSDLERDAQEFADALGLTLTVTQKDADWLSGEAAGSGGAVYTVWADASGIALDLVSDAGLAYEDASDALTQWSASRGGDGAAATAERTDGEERTVRLWTADESDAAAALIAYTGSAVTATLSSDGTVLSLRCAPRVTQEDALALRSEDEARAEALASAPDGTELRFRVLSYADGGSGDLVPYYVFFACSETDGVLWAEPVSVSAVQN